MKPSAPKRVLFRTDASTSIGSGHVVRCLTLAEGLRQRDYDCCFVCREHSGNLIDLIRNRGFTAIGLPLDVQSPSRAVDEVELTHANWVGARWEIDAQQTLFAANANASRFDWLVVDHYGLDFRWEQCMRTVSHRIFAIDDLGDRQHDCDILLDQNITALSEDRYTGKVPIHCGLILGPRYALLQPPYAELRKDLSIRQSSIQRILVYFGGSDLQNLTGMAVSAILSLRQRSEIQVDVVVSSSFPFLDELNHQINSHPEIKLYGALPSLAQLMARADLSIGAGGATSWERCCLGLPSLVITLADNQFANARELDRLGYIRWLGHQDEVAQSQIAEHLQHLIDQADLSEWSQHCTTLVDGLGTSRVCTLIDLDSTTQLVARRATSQDEVLILDWANEPTVRRNAFTPDPIDAATHHQWFVNRLNEAEECRFFVIETKNSIPIGQVRFQREGNYWEVHYSMDRLARGRNMGTELLRTALLEFTREFDGVEVLGKVKSNNAASLRIFEKLGFHCVPSADEAQAIFRQRFGRKSVNNFVSCIDS